MGNLYQELNDQESAIALYQRAVAAQSDFAPAHQNLGVLWTVNNEPLRALHH
ncbi:MAG: tetratricopeptide repeat protein, partial [Planctomycetota bacterium]